MCRYIIIQPNTYAHCRRTNTNCKINAVLQIIIHIHTKPDVINIVMPIKYIYTRLQLCICVRACVMCAYSVTVSGAFVKNDDIVNSEGRFSVSPRNGHLFTC